MQRERNGVTHKVHVSGMVGYVTMNIDDDGALREVFIHGFGTYGSTLQGWADSFAIMLSIALQRGTPLTALAPKFLNKRFDPAGKTDNPEIPWCNSIPDYIFRLLALRFHDDDLRGMLTRADADRRAESERTEVR